MSAVDNLIFNALASRSGVFLPELGSLTTKVAPARIKGRRKLQVPHWRVVFTPEQVRDVVSIVDLIATQAEVDRAGAEQIYDGWQQVAVSSGRLKIEGVGELFLQKFAISSELNSLLNPQSHKDIKLKRRGNRVGVWIVSLIVMIAVAGGVYYYMGITDFARKFSKKYNLCCSSAKTTIEPIVLDTVAIVVPDTIQVAAQEVVAVAVPKPYQVVAGIYSTQENVDKFLSSAQRKGIDADKFTVIPMSNGKFMVSLGGADTEADARTIRRSYLWFDNELWVTKVPSDPQN